MKIFATRGYPCTNGTTFSEGYESGLWMIFITNVDLIFFQDGLPKVKGKGQESWRYTIRCPLPN